MKPLRNYLGMLIALMVILSWYIPLRYQTPYPRDIKPQFDSYIKDYSWVLNETRPDIFLLGDSMLEKGIDDKYLADQLNVKIFSLFMYNRSSAVWYLILKNNIVVADHKPKYLIIFFRDTLMTVPHNRVTGNFFELVDEFAGSTDEILIQRAYIDPMNPLEKLAERYLPLYGSRWRIRQSIDYYIRYSLVKILLGCDQSCMDNAMDTIFVDNNLDKLYLNQAVYIVDEDLYSKEELDFNHQVGSSFLPEIIRLCKENDIQLVLVRMPIRRFEAPGTEPEGLNRYIQNLETYVKQNDVIFLDVDREKTIPITYFDDSFHLNETGRIEFTNRLIEALKPIIR